MFNIEYNNGRGRAQIDLNILLPCSAADMKRLLSMVNLSSDPDERAKFIYDHIASHIAELKEKRSSYNENNAAEKEKIKKINAVMKKYLSNAGTIAKQYDFPELTDKDAQIKMHAATVYALIFNSSSCPGKNKTTVEPFSGWTFEKDGYVFDVRRENTGYYIILLHGTGLQVTTTSNKNSAPAEITGRLIETLKNGSDKINEAKIRFNKFMIEAGYMDPDERPESISENAEEKADDIEVQYTFTAQSITCNGKTFPAEYNIIENGSVLVFAILRIKENGRKEKQRICFTPDHPDYPAALAAAKAFQAAPAPETVQAAPAPETVQAAPAPEKPFIGETIQGRGWKILFDAETSRTRVIFDKIPPKKVRETVKTAGFYYSPYMKSWNKKLTFKAYRAAKALSIQLAELYAA